MKILLFTHTVKWFFSFLTSVVLSVWVRAIEDNINWKNMHLFTSETGQIHSRSHAHVCESWARAPHLCHQPDSGCSPQGWSTQTQTQPLLTPAAAWRTSSPTHLRWRALKLGTGGGERRGKDKGRRGIEMHGPKKGKGCEEAEDGRETRHMRRREEEFPFSKGGREK